MGHGIKLTETQRDELDRHRMRATSADVFRNCLIILFSDSRDTNFAVSCIGKAFRSIAPSTP